MTDIDRLLKRWLAAGVLTAEAAAGIRAFEAKQVKEDGPGAAAPWQAMNAAGAQWQAMDAAGVKWQGIVALVLGAMLLACGVALFVSAHWDELGPVARLTVAMALVAVFHVCGGMARASFRGLSTALHAVGTVAAGASIALVGQIFNMEEHWPAAVLLWALAALAGWILLRDEAQEALALLLAPAWIVCEMAYAMERHIGQNVFVGRALLTWGVLYLTYFLGSRRHVVKGILFAAGAIAGLAGIALMVTGWESYAATETLVPFSTRVWAWVALGALPLAIAAFHRHKGLIPPALGVGLAIALPWSTRTWTVTQTLGARSSSHTQSEPNLTAYALVALLAVFLCWWGVREGSKALVNLGIVGFGMAVAWFYLSDILSRVGRSLGLITLGVLFLAGGWILEKMRRRILARMGGTEAAQ